MKLKALTEQYLEALKTDGKSERTLYTYGKDLEQILTFFGGEREVDSINKPEVGKFLKSDELLRLPNGKDRAPQTVKKTQRVLRMLLVYAVNHGLLNEAPLPKALVPTSESIAPDGK